VETWDWLAIIF